MKTTVSRVGGAVASLAIGVSIALTASPAQADSPEQTSAATWLAAQPDSTTHLFESAYGTGPNEKFTDYGLNLDLQFALRELGEADAADATYEAVVADGGSYIDQFGTRYSGNVGKLATMIQLNDGDPTADVEGVDLIEALEDLIVTTGAETGRGKDTPDGEFQSANTVGQSWDVRALTAADSDLADEATTFLLGQQCQDGGFRLYYSATDPCSSSVDATLFSITALQDASGSITGLDDDIADAVAWVEGQQASDGSFSDAGNANSNSTGYAARVLRELSDKCPAPDVAAAAWVSGVQVKSGDEAGAIASTKAAFDAVATEGITTLKRDSFVRASVQAALGLSDQPAATFGVTGPTTYISKGRLQPVTATGLAPGEKATFTLSGGNTVCATADDNGTATASVTPTGVGTRTVWVTGSAAARKGSTTLKIVGPKTLPTSVRSSTVKAGKTQAVTVTGLAASEPVRVYYAGLRIKEGTASSTGKYTLVFNARPSKGTKTVTILGAFGDRKGSKSFKVK